MKTITLSLRKLLGIIVVVVLGTSGTAYGLTVLFSHTVPSVTVTTLTLFTTCATATLAASSASVFSGTSGTITLQCPGPVAVFTSARGNRRAELYTAIRVRVIDYQRVRQHELTLHRWNDTDNRSSISGTRGLVRVLSHLCESIIRHCSQFHNSLELGTPR